MSVVTAVRSGTATLPLPAPLTLGRMVVERREYAAVEVLTDDGLVGKAYCLTREAPMAAIVDRLVSPHVIGRDGDVTSLWDAMLRGSAIVGRVGLVRKAIGLVDIALWDVEAQRAGQPMWKLLGQDAAPREAMIVSSYPTSDRSPHDVVAEVAAHAAAGWPLLKVARSPDRTAMRTIVHDVLDELDHDQRLVVDAGFAWRDAGEAADEVAAWGQPDLAWLEDPLLPEDVAGYARLRRACRPPIGVGDEVTDPRAIEALLDADAADVARLDVVAIGGVTPALDVLRRARDRGVPVSGHVYPEVCVHLGIGVETFDRDPSGNPYDPSHLLIEGGPAFEAGTATPPTGPGLGFTLDRDRFGFAPS